MARLTICVSFHNDPDAQPGLCLESGAWMAAPPGIRGSGSSREQVPVLGRGSGAGLQPRGGGEVDVGLSVWLGPTALCPECRGSSHGRDMWVTDVGRSGW